MVSQSTSSKLVMTDGLPLDSVNADTGVLSPSLPAPDAALTTVVGVNDVEVATVLVLEAAVTVAVDVAETEVSTVLILEAAAPAVVGVDEMEVVKVVVLEAAVTVALDTEETDVMVAVDAAVFVVEAELLVGIFCRMSSLAFHPS